VVVIRQSAPGANGPLGLWPGGCLPVPGRLRSCARRPRPRLRPGLACAKSLTSALGGGSGPAQRCRRHHDDEHDDHDQDGRSGLLWQLRIAGRRRRLTSGAIRKLHWNHKTSNIFLESMVAFKSSRGWRPLTRYLQLPATEIEPSGCPALPRRDDRAVNGTRVMNVTAPPLAHTLRYHDQHRRRQTNS